MEDVKKVFNDFDSNGDGKIDVSELHLILLTLSTDASPEEIASIMSEIDSDGDGFIELKKFAAFHLANSGDDCAVNKELRDAFDMYERDKNGFISVSKLHYTLKIIGHGKRRKIKEMDFGCFLVDFMVVFVVLVLVSERHSFFTICNHLYNLICN
ncbi:putative calcium-binding protein CML23 [Apium graveolens]|uniref:putative calcium-binding protein CML23 n=1 Tax=Apium graveolens TaxID=4045 RepID=UPI003D7B4F3A